MNDVQQQVLSLMERAEPRANLKHWINGRIPRHYKRLTVSMGEAIELAKEGAAEAMAFFGTRLYFTQSLIMGAAVSGKYKKIIVVTPSQYGKSWLCGQISILLANKGRPVYVAGGNANTTEIIMNKVMHHIQGADDEIKGKLLEHVDKIERLQTAMSKKKLSFRGGGLIEGISLGESFKDPKKGNSAIGRGGDYILDEASLVSDDAYAELGRRDFADENGEGYISLEISNPHNPGRFFDELTGSAVPEKCLIVWMDVRTALEEGRVKSKEQVIHSEFFKNKSTCKRYFLCELEDYSEDSLFPEAAIHDGPASKQWEYFLGVDSAYKGKDEIKAALTAIDGEGKIYLMDCETIKKDQWVDGETSRQIVSALARLIKAYRVKMACIDIGYGIYIVEGLCQQILGGCSVKGINFGAGTTKERRELRHYAAVYGDNMRAELYLDLQDLMDNGAAIFSQKMAEMLKPQMNATKAVRKPNGKTAIIPKDEIKQIIGKSPDELDAALLSVHAAILYSMSAETLIYGE